MSKSHFTLAVPFNYGVFGDARKREVEKRDATRRKLKAAGYKERYFAFTDGDKASKAYARTMCEVERDLWKHVAGIELEIVEGFFL